MEINKKSQIITSAFVFCLSCGPKTKSKNILNQFGTSGISISASGSDASGTEGRTGEKATSGTSEDTGASGNANTSGSAGIGGTSGNVSTTGTPGTSGVSGSSGTGGASGAPVQQLGLSTFQPADIVIGQRDFYTTENSGEGCMTGSVINLVQKTDKNFNQPEGNPAIVNDTLYLSDTQGSRVLGFSPIPKTSHPSASFELGDVFMPTSMQAFDGKFLLADAHNDRVLIWNQAPTSTSQIANYRFGKPNNTRLYLYDGYHMHTAQDAMVASNKLIVADVERCRVLVWHNWPQRGSNSEASMVIGQPSFNRTCAKNHPAQPINQSNNFLFCPHGVFSDGTKLFIADTYHHRVLVWNQFPTSQTRSSPSFIIGSPQGDQGTSASLLAFPTTMAYDGKYFFLTDSGNHRVLIWENLPNSAQDLPIAVIGQANFTNNKENDDPDRQGPSARTLSCPRGVYVDAKRLIVTDTVNNRFLIFNRK